MLAPDQDWNPLLKVFTALESVYRYTHHAHNVHKATAHNARSMQPADEQFLGMFCLHL